MLNGVAGQRRVAEGARDPARAADRRAWLASGDGRRADAPPQACRLHADRPAALPAPRHAAPFSLHGQRVPAVNLDGRRVGGTLRISRALDALAPDPPLFPADREPVERTEAWAEASLQECVRQLAWWLVHHDSEAMRTFLDGARLGVPTRVVERALPVIRPIVLRGMPGDDGVMKASLAALRGHLDHVEALLAAGVIGGERPNAADFHIAACVRLAMTLEQLGPWISERPAGAHALRVCPDYPGRFRAVIPPTWLPY